MRKKLFNAKQLNLFVITVLVLITTVYLFSISTKAKGDSYENAFNIHDAVQYAMTNAGQDTNENKIPYGNGGIVLIL